MQRPAATLAVAGTGYLVFVVRRNRGLELLPSGIPDLPQALLAQAIPVQHVAVQAAAVQAAAAAAIPMAPRLAIEAPRPLAADLPVRERQEALR